MFAGSSKVINILTASYLAAYANVHLSLRASYTIHFFSVFSLKAKQDLVIGQTGLNVT